MWLGVHSAKVDEIDVMKVGRWSWHNDSESMLDEESIPCDAYLEVSPSDNVARFGSGSVYISCKNLVDAVWAYTQAEIEGGLPHEARKVGRWSWHNDSESMLDEESIPCDAYLEVSPSDNVARFGSGSVYISCKNLVDAVRDVL
ncbi:hypothetical protein VNO78_11420 [Psophocarpus tetragonolobus]|uniref:Uncharacterized protein n=1 Tax=Psophocarpus tetragonolobus TaxID=3891 RepID=A0AAN9SLE6_PSOTE